MTDFMSRVQALRDITSPKKLLAESAKLAKELPAHEVEFIAALKPLMTAYLFDSAGYLKISKTDFFVREVSFYTDVDELPKAAVRVSYLQPFEDYDAELDEEVASAIAELLRDLHLQYMVNDVTVNFVQVYNGEKLERDYWE